MEQIDEDLYHYFIPDSNKEKSNSSFGLNHHLNEGSNKKNKNKKHNKNKFKWNQKIIPGLNDVEQKKPKTKKNKEEEIIEKLNTTIKEKEKELEDSKKEYDTAIDRIINKFEQYKQK